MAHAVTMETKRVGGCYHAKANWRLVVMLGPPAPLPFLSTEKIWVNNIWAELPHRALEKKWKKQKAEPIEGNFEVENLLTQMSLGVWTLRFFFWCLEVLRTLKSSVLEAGLCVLTFLLWRKLITHEPILLYHPEVEQFCMKSQNTVWNLIRDAHLCSSLAASALLWYL